MTNQARRIQAEPLTAAAFAPYGEVIEANDESTDRMNDGRFHRFDKVAGVDIVQPGSAAISIVRSLEACRLPYQFAMLEKHPLGSQAFVPLAPFVFLVVVAPPGEAPQDIRAFASNGQQGISYHRGTWHMPLIALETGQSFLVIDREGSTATTNLETFDLDRPMLLDADL